MNLKAYFHYILTNPKFNSMAEKFDLSTPGAAATQIKGIDIPSVSIPKGGGAIKGIDEKFEVNPVNGSASVGIPLPVAGARALSPQMSISYSSGAGNGIFGAGWALMLSDISRKTDKGLPRYEDEKESDVFLMAGSEDLVPELVEIAGELCPDEQTLPDGSVSKRYIPRREGSFSRIERLTLSDGTIRWKVTSGSNSTVLLGWTENSRVCDPQDPTRIFRWLPEFVYDNLGNCMQYVYSKDQGEDYTQIYPDTLLYCNRKPWYAGAPWPSEGGYMFKTVFDYGQYDLDTDHENPSRTIPAREDVFSSRRSGFEIRTSRLCRNVLLYNMMDEVPGGLALIDVLSFTYDQSPSMTLLTSVRSIACRKTEDGSYATEQMPPVNYRYSGHAWNSEVKASEDTHFPVGCTFVDLFNEGLPGILHADPFSGEMLYRSNLGNARFDEARPVLQRPNGKRYSIVDLEGDGKKQFSDMTPSKGGFYEIGDPIGLELGDEGSICPFRPFETLPSVSGGEKNIILIDLNGDGKAEMLVSSESVYMWYPSEGKKGYSNAEYAPMFIEGEDGPDVIFSDQTQTVFLADMTGDGLVDIVRIRCSEVFYYPNLGYGRFGRKVLMDNSPVLSSPDEFDPSRVLLADIDGTGTADLVYMGDGSFKCWMNQCGTAYSAEPYVIDDAPAVNDMSDVSMQDILGNGMSCIVWTSMLPNDEGRQLKYIDLMSGIKPYLMTGYSNSAGKSVTFEYRPSTAYYLEDKAAGDPWRTRLGFPVHCLSKVETYDAVSDWRFVSSYRYRDGYYDHVEREFRGFGMCEQKDTEEFEHWTLKSANLIDSSLHQKPVITRTWVNTGAEKVCKHDDVFQSLCEDVIEDVDKMTDDEYREALRALAGQVYRSEVYNDGDKTPCAVTVASAKVKMYQRKGPNRHASFIAMQYQSFARAFEDDPSDPRISQSINLTVDRYGNVLEAASIAYGRRKTDETTPEKVTQLQAADAVSYVKLGYSERIDTADVLLHKVPVSEFSYEVKGLEKHEGEFYVPEDFSASYIEGKTRLIQGGQSLFFSGDLKTPLPVGKTTFPLISYGSYQLAFTPDKLQEIYGGKVTDRMLEEGKYVRLENEFVDDAAKGGWWVSSGNVWLLEEGETPEAAKARFYSPLKYTDIYGTPTWVEYYGDTWMIVSAVINAFKERSSIEQIDFQTLQPLLVKDVNGNLSSAVYDVAGRVKASAIMGKGDEADSLDGFTIVTDVHEQSLIASFFKETDPVRMTEIAKELLGKASVRYVYDPYSWMNESIPVRAATITREQHHKDNPDSEVQISIAYSNGSGSAVLSKVQAEPDPDKPGTFMRWIGNGRTIVNNKGNVVMQYEPYFSDTPAYESAKEIVETGVTPILYYDALGRNIRTEYPDGTFDKVEIHSWNVVGYGAGATVKESEWYRSRMALDKNDLEYMAAVKSEVYADVGSVSYIDCLGRPVATKVADMMSFAELDLEGSLLSITDPRGIVVQTYEYDHLGRVLYSCGPDNGRKWNFTDAQGNPVRTWNDRGIRAEYYYDEVRRPLMCKAVTDELKEGEKELDHIFARWQYAESLLGRESMESLQEKNLLGQVIAVWDTAGKVSTERYDFKGLPLLTERRLTKTYKGMVNWTEDVLESALDNEVFTGHVEVDALGRTVKEVSPDGTVLSSMFNKGGLMSKTTVHLSGEASAKEYISGVTYNEKRQLCHMEYGNGIVTDYTYDKLTMMVREVESRRANGSLIQHFGYTFDVSGRLSHVQDKSEKVYYHDNKIVSPDSDYTYDCLGRLVKAEGRENKAAVGRDCYDDFDDKDFMCQLADMDAMTIRPYSEEYSYDKSGNILTMHHISAGNTWTREYTYATDSNRLLKTQIGDYSYAYKYHPTAGYMVQMPHLVDIGWNFLEQVESSTRQVRTDGGTPETTYYQYDGSGKRIRKTTVCASDTGEGQVKDERIYIGGYEVYRKHSGAYKGLERVTTSLMAGSSRLVIIERRNDVDDGTEKKLERYQFANVVGSSVLEIDDRCRVITKEEYTPYGSTSYQAHNKAIKAASKRYRYTGMERDEETGLSYHTARYYIPWLGRWLSADPIGIQGGVNLYCYCDNDPVNLNDVAGTDGLTRVFGGIQLVGGVLEALGGAAIAAATSWTGVGLAAGTLVTIHGIDQIQAGALALVTGESTNTVLKMAVSGYAYMAGADSETAENVGNGVDFFVGLCVPNPGSKMKATRQNIGSLIAKNEAKRTPIQDEMSENVGKILENEAEILETEAQISKNNAQISENKALPASEKPYLSPFLPDSIKSREIDRYITELSEYDSLQEVNKKLVADNKNLNDYNEYLLSGQNFKADYGTSVKDKPMLQAKRNELFEERDKLLKTDAKLKTTTKRLQGAENWLVSMHKYEEKVEMVQDMQPMISLMSFTYHNVIKPNESIPVDNSSVNYCPVIPYR